MKHKQDREMTPTAKSAGKNGRHLFAFLLLFFSISLAYSNSLSGTWAMDDVVANKPVGLRDIQDFIGFRKVAYLTFLLNQALAPFTPANFRLFNMLIHLLNAVLVYILAFRTINIMSGPEHATNEIRKLKDRSAGGISFGDAAFHTALFSSIIFALHPININAVAYIVQRMASLATFFILISLLCYSYAAISKSTSKAIGLYILSGLSIVAGIFSKENAVIAVPLLLLYDYTFLLRCNLRLFKKRFIVIIGIGIVSVSMASYFLNLHTTFIDIVRFFLYPNTALTERGWMAVDVHWTPLQHILTEFRVVSRYLILILIPLPKLLVFDWWGFPISTSLTEPITTMLSMIFLLSLVMFSVWRIKRFPLLCFGILWYFIAISLESFFALGVDLYFEHRNYLPVTGLFIGIVGQMVLFLKGKINERVLWTSASIVCIILGSLTFARNFVWKDSITLWGDTIKKTASNIRAMISLGNAYVIVPDFDNAKRCYKDAVRTSAEERRLAFLNASVYRLGLTYLFERNLQEAKKLIANMEETIDSYHLKILKGFYKASSGDIDEAIRLYSEILPSTKGTDTTVVYTLLGDAFRENGSWDRAIEQYQNALSRDLSFSAAYYGLGVSYMSKRDIIRADYYFKKALSLDPNNILALSDMADLSLIQHQRPEDALLYAQRAIAKSPPFYQPYLAMGNVLLVIGREKDAEGFYRKAVEHGMPDYMVPFSKARAYYIKGDIVQAKYFIAELKRYRDLPEKFKSLIQQDHH